MSGRRRRAGAEDPIAALVDRDLEAGLLGHLLLRPGAFADLDAAGVTAVLFHDERHRAIFDAAALAVEEGLGADPGVVLRVLEDRGGLAAVGAPYVVRLTSGVPQLDAPTVAARVARLRTLAEARTRYYAAEALTRAIVSDPTSSAAAISGFLVAIGTLPSDPAAREGRFRSAAEVMTDPAPGAIVEGLLWESCITTMVADSNVGKTFVALSLAGAISQARPWHGRPVRHGSVAYLSFEGDAIGKRLRALAQQTGGPLAHVYVLKASAPLSPLVTRDSLEVPSPGERAAAEALRRLAAELEAAGGPPLVNLTVDTVRASLSGSEDASENVAAYLRVVRRLVAPLPGASALLLHHAGWQDGERPKKRERGSSTWRGNVDATVFLDLADDDDPAAVRLVLETRKSRDGQKAAPLSLIRREVVLEGEYDPWGQPVRTCVMEPDARSQADRQAEADEAAARAIRDVDLKVLTILRDHPACATSQAKIRAAIALRKDVVEAAVVRLLGRRHILPPASQRLPYTLTDGGREMLARGGNL